MIQKVFSVCADAYYDKKLKDGVKNLHQHQHRSFMNLHALLTRPPTLQLIMMGRGQTAALAVTLNSTKVKKRRSKSPPSSASHHLVVVMVIPALHAGKGEERCIQFP